MKINYLTPTKIHNLGSRYHKYPGPYAIDDVDLEYIFPNILDINPNNLLEYKKGNLNETNLSLINRLVKYLQPKIILEIGTFDGRTTYNLYKNSPTSTIITIDTDDDPPNVSGPDVEYLEYEYKGEWIKDIDDIIRIDWDSTCEYCFTELMDVLDGRNIDFAFIDGGHGFYTVKHDFEELVLPFLSPMGVVVFDDYNNLISEVGVTSYLTRKAYEDNYIFYWYAPKGDRSNEVIFINNVKCRNYNWRYV